jgi:hypothetical protein
MTRDLAVLKVELAQMKRLLLSSRRRGLFWRPFLQELELRIGVLVENWRVS